MEDSVTSSRAKVLDREAIPYIRLMAMAKPVFPLQIENDLLKSFTIQTIFITIPDSIMHPQQYVSILPGAYNIQIFFSPCSTHSVNLLIAVSFGLRGMG